MLNIFYILLMSNLFFYKVNKNLLINYFNCVVTLIFGLRYDMGIDYLAYRRVFISGEKTRFEYGYLFLSNVVKNLTNNFTILMIITIFLQIHFFTLGLKKKYEKTFEIALGYFFLFADKIFFTFLNAIRSGIAISILFYAVMSYENKKKYLLLILIASLFHKSVLIVIPIVFIIDKIRMNKKMMIICAVVILLLFRIDLLKFYEYIYKYIPSSYQVYNISLLRSYEVQGVSISGLISTIFKILLLVFGIENEKKVKLEYKLALLGLGLRLFSMKNFIFARVGGFFDIFLIIFLIDFVSNNIKKNIVKKILAILILLLFSIFYLKTANFENERNKLNYKSIFLENDLVNEVR